MIIYDDEYTAAVAHAEPELGKLRALGVNPDSDKPSGSTDETLADVIARGNGRPAPKASKHPSIIILTSGTTGTPKGANRAAPPSLAPIGGVLSHVPFKAGEVTSLPAPMFHALGFLHATIAMMLGTTLVLRRRFKPATVLEDVEKHQVTAMVVVPVMLSRMLDHLEQMKPKPNLSSTSDRVRLRVPARRRAGLPGARATSGRSSTTSTDRPRSRSRASPGPRTCRSTRRRSGRWSRASPSRSSTTTATSCRRARWAASSCETRSRSRVIPAAGKQIIDGMLSSGDVGYFDEHGLLYVSGRDDEMIVSGGENVFPAEVEDLISGHPDVIEATALGVEDKEWGARLKAFVVKAEGADLDEDSIKTYVKEHLARYKVPREVVFLDELPRNPTGKILKRELRNLE